MELKNVNGMIHIENEVISQVVGLTVMEMPGVVGMASIRKLKDEVVELLKKDNYGKGIETNVVNGRIELDLHVIVLYGVNIVNIAVAIQNQVKYILNEQYGIPVAAVNVKIEDVRVQ